MQLQLADGHIHLTASTTSFSKSAVKLEIGVQAIFMSMEEYFVLSKMIKVVDTSGNLASE